MRSVITRRDRDFMLSRAMGITGSFHGNKSGKIRKLTRTMSSRTISETQNGRVMEEIQYE
jgi:hypothetical protein